LPSGPVLFPSTRWRGFPLPRGLRFSCFFSLREGLLSCPSGTRRSGLGRPRGLRPSAPSAATEQGRPAVGSPRCSREAAPATPNRETPARVPQPPEAWPRHPRGAGKTPSGNAVSRTCRTDFPVRRGCLRRSLATGGWRHIRPAGHRSDGAGACGPPTGRPAWGDGAAVSCRRRGTARRAALSGRTRRRVGGLGSKPSLSDRCRPAGQERGLPRSGKKVQARAPARCESSRNWQKKPWWR
jgi:hypothetical protein